MAVGTATKATRVLDAEPASIEVMVGPSDSTRARRVDVEVRPGLESGLQVAIAIPPELKPTVTALIRALSVTAGKGL